MCVCGGIRVWCSCRFAHCHLEGDGFLQAFRWDLQQLSHHPDLLSTHHRRHFLPLSLQGHTHSQEATIVHHYHCLSALSLPFSCETEWNYVACVCACVHHLQRPDVARSRCSPDEGLTTEACRCHSAPLEWNTGCPWHSANAWSPPHHPSPLWCSSLPTDVNTLYWYQHNYPHFV